MIPFVQESRIFVCVFFFFGGGGGGAVVFVFFVFLVSCFQESQKMVIFVLSFFWF